MVKHIILWKIKEDIEEVYRKCWKYLSCENGLLLYSVADNIRKGAAANAVQIAMVLTGLDY